MTETYDILHKAGLENSVWGQRLLRGEAGEEVPEMREAGDWPTCACGRVTAGIPRDEDGEPDDDVLYGLGTDFPCAIPGMIYSRVPPEVETAALLDLDPEANIVPSWPLAARILVAIEQRGQVVAGENVGAA